jgi:TetR/AcrR family transcriptional regulator, tetracycline repressor protein
MINNPKKRVNKSAAPRPKRPGRPKKGAGVIDLEKIVTTAWTVVDRHGMAALSTRALAAALNVKSPALYWYVHSKDELLSLMMEQLLQNSLDDAPPNLAWSDWLKYVGRRQRELLLSHRDGGLIASLAAPTERLRTQIFPRIMEPLLAAGFRPLQASAAAGGLAALVLGWVIYEQRPATREFVETFHTPSEAFELALENLVRGIAAR